MNTDLKELYEGAQVLFQAFNYLHGRMEGAELLSPRPMNPEALAGCILHGCLGRLLREIQERRTGSGMILSA